MTGSGETFRMILYLKYGKKKICMQVINLFHSRYTFF